MTRNERMTLFLTVASLLVAILGCIAAYLVIPQIQSLFFPTAISAVTQSGGNPTPESTAKPVCVVPNIVGLDRYAAEKSLRSLGLRPIESNQYDSTPPGNVVSQYPAGSTRIDPCGGDVLIVISLGPLSNASPTQSSLPTETLDLSTPSKTATHPNPTQPRPNSTPNIPTPYPVPTETMKFPI